MVVVVWLTMCYSRAGCGAVHKRPIRDATAFRKQLQLLTLSEFPPCLNAYNENLNACQIKMSVFSVFCLQFVFSYLTGSVTQKIWFGGVEYRSKAFYEVAAGVVLHKRSLPGVQQLLRCRLSSVPGFTSPVLGRSMMPLHSYS